MKKIHNLFFVLLILLVSALFNQPNTMSDPPRSVHQWRQSDGYSIALNYYNNGMHFFEPRIHFQESKEGKAVGEFPIIYYLQAAIWKITGPSYFVARFTIFLFSIIGLFALFKTIYGLLNDTFVAYLLPLLLFSSPLFAYYSNSYLTNIPALSFLFVGWYFLFRFSERMKTTSLLFAVLFVTLAGLLRPTMLIGYVPLVILFFINRNKLIDSEKIKKQFIYGTALFLPFILVACWVLFTKTYNSQNNSVYFLSNIRPIWICENIPHVWSKFTHAMLDEFYHGSVKTIIVLVLISMLFTIKRQNRNHSIVTVGIVVGLIIYILLWFSNLDVHDYYLIELFLVIPPLFIGFFSYVKENYQEVFYARSMRVTASIILIVSILYGASKTRMKHEDKVFFFTEVFLSEEEIVFYKWYHWDYETKYQAFETIEPYLRSIGISKKDLVVSLPDQSPNITLSFMDQKGFSFLYCTNENMSEKLKEFKAKGAKYLLICDRDFIKNTGIETFTQEKIGTYKNIEIFKL